MSKHINETRPRELKKKIQLKQQSMNARNNFTRPRDNMGELHRRHK